MSARLHPEDDILHIKENSLISRATYTKSVEESLQNPLEIWTRVESHANVSLYSCLARLLIQINSLLEDVEDY